MFGYMTTNVKYYILSQILYKTIRSLFQLCILFLNSLWWATKPDDLKNIGGLSRRSDKKL